MKKLNTPRKLIEKGTLSPTQKKLVRDFARQTAMAATEVWLGLGAISQDEEEVRAESAPSRKFGIRADARKVTSKRKRKSDPK
jgi:hypothetical protein